MSGGAAGYPRHRRGSVPAPGALHPDEVHRPIPSYTNPAARTAARIQAVAPVDHDAYRAVTEATSFQSSCANSRPFGDDDDASAPRTASSALSANSTPGISVRASCSATGSYARTRGAVGLQARGEDERGRLAHVVGVRLEREAEQRDALADERAEVLLELGDHAALLELVDLDHRGQQLEVVARSCRRAA